MTKCPHCHIRYTDTGQPNCWCDAPSQPARLTDVSAPRRLWWIQLDDTGDATCRIDRPQPIPRRLDTVAMLQDLPDLAAHLELRIMTSEPGAEPGGGRREARTVMPGNIAIMHALDARVDRPNESQEPDTDDGDGRRGALGELASWARAIHEDLDGYEPLPAPLPELTMASVCAWLVTHYLTWSAVMPEVAPEFEHEVERWHSTMRRALGETDPVQLRHRYPEGEACGHEIRQRTDSLFQCKGCMQTWSLVEMMRQARWHSDVTLAEAADQLGVKLGTLKQWVKRGKLAPVDDRRPARYRLRDIREQMGA